MENKYEHAKTVIDWLDWNNALEHLKYALVMFFNFIFRHNPDPVTRWFVMIGTILYIMNQGFNLIKSVRNKKKRK